MKFATMKASFEAMQDEIVKAAAGKPEFKYSTPLVTCAFNQCGINIYIGFSRFEEKTATHFNFEDAIADAWRATKKVCAFLDDRALARTLGVEAAE